MRIFFIFTCLFSLCLAPRIGSAQNNDFGDSDWAWNSSKTLAMALFAAGDWENALVYLNDLGEKTTDWHLQYTRAKALLHIGKLEQAKTVALAALISHPENPRILFLCADVYLDSSNYEEAEKFYRMGLARRPKELDALLSMGRALMAREKYEEAIQHYESIIESKAGSGEVLQKLAFAYEKINNYEKSEYYLIENSLQHQNAQMGLMPLYRFYLRWEKMDEAAAIQKRILEIEKSRDKRSLRDLLPSKR